MTHVTMPDLCMRVIDDMHWYIVVRDGAWSTISPGCGGGEHRQEVTIDDRLRAQLQPVEASVAWIICIQMIRLHDELIG